MLNLATANNIVFYGGALASPLSLIKSWPSFLMSSALKKPSRSNLSDDACVSKIANGDDETFEILFDRYGDLVFGYCRKFLKEVSMAEDASQEAWVKVIKNAEKYKAQGKFRAWLLQITRNVCLSILRTRKTNIPTENIDDVDPEIEPKDFVNEIVERCEKEKLKEQILLLPDNQRIAILIWMSEEKSYYDIAVDMGTSVSAIKSLIYRGKETLKLWLESQ